MEILGRMRILFALSALLLASPVLAQNLQLAEQKIKVGMIYNFLKYTDWPAAQAGQPMAVCIFGDNPFGDSLQPMQGRSVNQRAIVIRTVSAADEVGSCQLIIVASDSEKSWPSLQTALTGKPVLTVGDYEGFIKEGGVIEFGHRDDHISVELNSEALTAAGLSVQPRMRGLMTISRSRP